MMCAENACIKVYVWRSENIFMESIFYFNLYVGSRDGIWVIRPVQPTPLPTKSRCMAFCLSCCSWL